MGWVGPRTDMGAVAKRKKFPVFAGNRIPIVQHVA
jgi:hypothetical protein